MKKLHSLLVTVSLTAASILSAQTTASAPGVRGPQRGGPGGPGHGRGPMIHPIVRALDADRDGEVSASELANAPAALLALDANKDGAVSRAEFHPPRPERPADAPVRTPPADAPVRKGGDRAHPVDPVMLALDADADGNLSGPEIAAAARSLAAIDANKDGKLTRDELRPLPPA